MGSVGGGREDIVMALLASAIWLIAVISLIWRALRQDRAFRRLAPAPPEPDIDWPAVTVVIPARDEAENIGDCLSALAQQDYPRSQLRIVVADDDSADATATVVSSVACEDGRCALLRAPPLPAGWTGKAHACWAGSRAAAASTQWLCFMDADVRAGPALLTTAIGEAIKTKADLLSLTPRQELGSFAERLVMPCGFYMLAFLQDLARIQASKREATASGKFILVRYAAYESFGGHAAVRHEICEDAALARRAKSCGYRVILAGGERLASTRMYAGWRSLRAGVSKNLADMMGGPAMAAVTAIAGITLAWMAVLLPLAELGACGRAGGESCVALLIALPGSAAFLALHIAGAVHFRIPVWYGLLFPLGYTAGALIALESVRRRLTGQRVWKGRVYP
ncbi:MAG: glycosyltransferase [Methylocapsa sp.]|nr:glycosyltransferase [Methylocapsa sp.]